MKPKSLDLSRRRRIELKKRSKKKKKENVPRWEAITNLMKNKNQLHKNKYKKMQNQIKKILQPPNRRMQNLTLKRQVNKLKPSNSTRNS